MRAVARLAARGAQADNNRRTLRSDGHFRSWRPGVRVASDSFPCILPGFSQRCSDRSAASRPRGLREIFHAANTNTPEIRFALDTVRAASKLVAQVQAELVTSALTKDDKSPVTVADYGAQALVGYLLDRAFPNDPLVGEEDLHRCANRRTRTRSSGSRVSSGRTPTGRRPTPSASGSTAAVRSPESATGR